MQEEKISFKNSKNLKICGILSNPKLNKKKPIIILCHGFGTSKNGRTYLKLQKILNGQDISIFRFDFFGHGESEGNLEDITISEAVNDILSAISFLKDQGYSKIGLVGSSFGGISSIIAASTSNDLFVLALKSPVSNYKEVEIKRIGKEGIREWKKRGYIKSLNSNEDKFKLKYSFFEDFKNNNAYEVAKNIKIPTLIVHGNRDESVPVEQSIKMAKLIENCKLEIIKNADHRYSKIEDFNKMTNLIAKFIVKNSKSIQI